MNNMKLQERTVYAVVIEVMGIKTISGTAMVDGGVPLAIYPTRKEAIARKKIMNDIVKPRVVKCKISYE